MIPPTLPQRQREFFSAVILFPGLTTYRIAAAVSISPSAAQSAAIHLERLGLIRSCWDGRRRAFYPAQEVFA